MAGAGQVTNTVCVVSVLLIFISVVVFGGGGGGGGDEGGPGLVPRLGRVKLLIPSVVSVLLIFISVVVFGVMKEDRDWFLDWGGSSY